MSLLGLILVSCLKWVASSSVSRHDYSEVKLFESPAAYDVESSVTLNDAGRQEREVGFKLLARLVVEPLWADSHSEFLLKFNLISPQLHLRGKHINANFRAFSSVWDSYKDTSFYVHWKSGVVQNAYLDPEELEDVLNYKRGLISLFQFQIIDGEYNETDATGVCDVLYESISSTVFRKIKRSCSAVNATEQDRRLAEHVSARRIARYTLGPGLRAVYADELLQLGGAELGVKARALTRLQPAAAPAPAPAPAAASLAAALRALPERLAPAALQLAGQGEPDDDLNLEEAIAANDEALRTEEAGEGGRAAHAAAALRLLPALRAAPADRLRRLLERETDPAKLSGLCRLLGLAGTRAALAAADGFLQLAAADPPEPLARAFLAALALAPAPAPAAVRDAAALAAAARQPVVAAAALLAATAAAARLADDELGRSLRDDIARSLAKCKDSECRAARLRALGQLRRGDSAELLLEAARAGGPAAALAALGALAELPARELHYARRRRLEPLALLPGRPLEVRAAALDLLVRRSAERPAALLGVALELQRRGPAELRRVLWQRLHQLAPRHAALRELLPRLPRELRSWHARAPAGTSAVLRRDTGAGAALESLQVAAGGLLRRSTVRLLGADDAELLAVEVWARGLEAVAGGGGGSEELYEGEEAPEPAATLALAVDGARLPPVDLFRGQAELLGHVWAGTGSAPTPVLRALLLRDAAAALPLGGLRLAAAHRRAAALALDAHAQVSLWSRNARAGLELRAGGAAHVSLALRTAWGRARAVSSAAAEPRLRIAADLDFYDAVALCVRVKLDDYDLRKECHLESVQGDRSLRVSRWRNETAPQPGRTLSLERAADAACRALAAND